MVSGRLQRSVAVGVAAEPNLLDKALRSHEHVDTRESELKGTT